MVTDLQRLLDDHRNLLRLLRFLREEIGHYDDPEIDTDLHQVLDALDYISSYPETCHHPMEEAAFDRMEQRGIGEHEVIQRIRAQHKELERATAELKRLLELVFNDHPVPIKRIKEALHDYLDGQFRHIEAEEQEIFPVMARELNDEDWRYVAAAVEARRDPLFNGTLTEPYAELSRRLGIG